MLRFLCLIALSMGASAFQNTQGTDREKDVYRIYSLLMTNPRTSHGPDENPRYLIAESTSLLLAQQPCVQPPKERAAEFDEVLKDFEARKATPRILKRELSIPKPYELLKPEDVSQFQKERSRLTPNAPAPDARFEGVTDLFILADVYFSKSGRLAMTAVASWCGSLCAQQEWKVLEKLPSGVWRQQAWSSCFIIAQLSATAPPARSRSSK